MLGYDVIVDASIRLRLAWGRHSLGLDMSRRRIDVGWCRHRCWGMRWWSMVLISYDGFLGLGWGCAIVLQRLVEILRQ